MVNSFISDSHYKCNYCRACSRSVPCHYASCGTNTHGRPFRRPYILRVKGRLTSSGIPPVTSSSKVQLSKGAVSGSRTKSTAGAKHTSCSIVSPQTDMEGSWLPSPSSFAPSVPSGLQSSRIGMNFLLIEEKILRRGETCYPPLSGSIVSRKPLRT